MNYKFYYTKDKYDNPRHVVVATGDVVDGKISVERVGLHDSVTGASRRGKHPSFVEPVDVATLTEMSSDEVSDDHVKVASEKLASAAISVESDQSFS